MTVLPPGTKWLTLALKCLGKNVNNFESKNPKPPLTAQAPQSADSDNDGDEEEGFDEDMIDLDNWDGNSNLIPIKKKHLKSSGGTKDGKGSTSGKDKTVVIGGNKSLEVDRFITLDESMQCEVITNLMNKISVGPVIKAPGLIRSIQELFSEWVTNDEDEDDEANNITNNYDDEENYDDLVISTNNKGNKRNNKVDKKAAKRDIKEKARKSKISNAANKKTHIVNAGATTNIKAILKKDSHNNNTTTSTTKANTTVTLTESIRRGLKRLSLSPSKKKKDTATTSTTATGQNHSVPESVTQPTEGYDYECDICHLYFMNPIKLYRHINKAHDEVDITSRLMANSPNNSARSNNSNNNHAFGTANNISAMTATITNVVTAFPQSNNSNVKMNTTNKGKDKDKSSKVTKTTRSSTATATANTTSSTSGKNDKKFKCKLCSRSFRFQIALTAHCQDVHENDED